VRLSTARGTHNGSLLRTPQAYPLALAVLAHDGEAVLAISQELAPVRLLFPASIHH